MGRSESIETAARALLDAWRRGDGMDGAGARVLFARVHDTFALPPDPPAPTMIRPDWDTFVRKTIGGYVSCGCGQMLQSVEAVREHWQRGHFDFVEPTKDPPAPDVETWAVSTRAALAERDALLRKVGQILWDEAPDANWGCPTAFEEALRRERCSADERDALLRDMAALLDLLSPHVTTRDGIDVGRWHSLAEDVALRYEKISPPGATEHRAEPAADSADTAVPTQGGAPGGSTDSEGPGAGAAEATCAQPETTPGTGAPGHSFCECGHLVGQHGISGCKAMLLHRPDHECPCGAVPEMFMLQPVGNRDERAAACCPDRPEPIRRDPAVPTGSLLSRVREALLHPEVPRCEVLGDLDEWIGRVRKALRHRLTAWGEEQRLEDCDALFRELLGDRP